MLHPRLARGEGASDRIADMIRKREITPKGIANALVAFYNNLLRTARDEEEKEALKAILDVVRDMRRKIKV